MIYLIGQLSIWLLLTAVSAGVAGWIFAAQRAGPERQALRRERDRLVRDLGRLAAGDDNGAAGPDMDADRARAEAADALTHVRESRIAELEHALETARARADEASSDAAELRRLLDQRESEHDELERLRGLSTALEAQRAREIEAEAIPVIDENDGALLAWRLRYFEQRARYLEAQTNHVAAVNAPPPSQQPDIAAPSPLPEWRAREAEARAAHLEQEVRALIAPIASERVVEGEAEPFASDVDVDVLLRWRLLYLERRVTHLQAQAAAMGELAPATSPQPPGPDPDMWKWRARYLEARVRHLEVRPPVGETAPAQALAAVPEPEPAATEPTPPPPRRAKPPVLAAARNGAPDDFTLIDDISLMQQTTLYSIGVFHYDQIAAWTGEHVAWVDQYLRLQGRITQEEWREQASALARHGPAVARRVLEAEDV